MMTDSMSINVTKKIKWITLVLAIAISAFAKGQVKDSSLHFVDSIQFQIKDSAQFPKTKIKKLKGVVFDKAINEPVAFATIYFPKSSVGTVADEQGYFELDFEKVPNDTLRIQAIGYKTFNYIWSKKPIDSFALFVIEQSNTMLKEVVVKAGESPSILFMKEVFKYKNRNDISTNSNYAYELYNKLEADVTGLTKEQFEKIPFTKPFSFIYNNLDSTSEQESFLPVYLIEALSDYYCSNNPKAQREVIKASLQRGIENESIAQFLGGMYQNINCYSNFVDVFNKKFISPLSSAGLLFYKYRITDTQYVKGVPVIQVQFKPKRKGENCFFGSCWIVDSNYSLQRIQLNIPEEANVNFIDKISIYQEYKPLDSNRWFLNKDKLSAHFILPYGSKLPGFIGRKTSSYKNIHVNESFILDSINRVANMKELSIAEGAKDKDKSYWLENRHDSLSQNEKNIYKFIDTVQTLPVFNLYKRVIQVVTLGTYDTKYFQFGPYWSMYSRNRIEGTRFRFSVGTTKNLYKDLYLFGYAAYGTLDQKWKYKGSALYLLSRSPRSYIYASYKHDLDRQTGNYEDATSDYLFGNIIRKSGVPIKLAFSDEYRLEYFKEHYNGLSIHSQIVHKDFKPYTPLPSRFVFDESYNDGASLSNTEFGIKLRYAYKEKFLEGDFLRASLGSKYPIVELKIAGAIGGFLKSSYTYQKAHLSVSDNISIAPFGNLYYKVFAGRVLGAVPYPLLEVHPGNDFHYYNKYDFNMMYRYEFISDRYAGFIFEHTVGNGIFNYIPLVKKFKFRQFWNLKGLYGNLSNENYNLNNPSLINTGYTFRTLANTPYIELGTGIENILQVFRLDFVWRLSPNNLVESTPRYFGVFGSVKFDF